MPDWRILERPITGSVTDRHDRSGTQTSRRHPHSLRVCTLLRKPDALRANASIAYVGFDIPNEFVVGYGLDYDERYRDLPYIGTLDPRVYQD